MFIIINTTQTKSSLSSRVMFIIEHVFILEAYQ